jgi:2-polyprenyl-6-methoxyphenol hydroxylase-like FAD-dependent oxidoreductase
VTADRFDKQAITTALRLTGSKLVWPGPVEIVIAGGAAGMLLGIWSADRVTEDCDIVEMSPPIQPRRAVMQAAREAAEEIGLNPDWLNDHFMTFGTLDTLPDGWPRRSVKIGTFGKLEVTYWAVRTCWP